MIDLCKGQDLRYAVSPSPGFPLTSIVAEAVNRVTESKSTKSTRQASCLDVITRVTLRKSDRLRNTYEKGDRICGFPHGTNCAQPNDGAFAESIIAKRDVLSNRLACFRRNRRQDRPPILDILVDCRHNDYPTNLKLHILFPHLKRRRRVVCLGPHFCACILGEVREVFRIRPLLENMHKA